MLYTEQDVFDYIDQEDVRFIRLTFCDLSGNQKNMSIMPHELRRAFDQGISFDASAIAGFGNVEDSDLFLVPIPSTLSVLPWRPTRGKVVRMFCNVKYPDGRDFPMDSRNILKNAVRTAAEQGISVKFGSEIEFYLFKTDEFGNPTKEPFDQAGYMDISPEDKGENVRREICLNLLSMGISPESSHHEEGPGQNEIAFRYSDALTAADNAINFVNVVKVTALGNGLHADFSPKPLPDKSGNGMHINISVHSNGDTDPAPAFMAGIMDHIAEMTAFLNPTENSYARLGEYKAPRYITWAHGNRSQLIRIPSASGEYRRMELRSPDPLANPYIAYALLIYAGLDGIRRGLTPPEPVNRNLLAPGASVCDLPQLPATLEEAKKLAADSAFIRAVLPKELKL